MTTPTFSLAIRQKQFRARKARELEAQHHQQRKLKCLRATLINVRASVKRWRKRLEVAQGELKAVKGRQERSGGYQDSLLHEIEMMRTMITSLRYPTPPPLPPASRTTPNNEGDQQDHNA